MSDKKIQHALKKVYGVSTSAKQLNRLRTKKWGSMSADQAQKSEDQRPYSRSIQETTILPSPVQAGFYQDDIRTREDKVQHWVNSYIDCYFTANQAAVREFDLLYSTPGEDYQISWQELNQITIGLPDLMNPKAQAKFSQTWRQILDGVRAAIRATREANALIFFWRICRQLLDMQQTEDAQHWFRNEYPIEALFAAILAETENDQNGLPLLLNRLIEVVYTAPRDEVTGLLERGYFHAIRRLRIAWPTETFTIPQMETNYLIRWNETTSHVRPLSSEYEKLILCALEKFGEDDERVFIFRHQFLFFLSRCVQDPTVIHCTAKRLYRKAKDVLVKRPGFIWNGVPRALGFAARILMTVHGQTLLDDVGEDDRRNAIAAGFAYPTDAYNL
ncbi:hypothetical protein AYL99_03153 [Fonsecaea erecta]|uniref:Clr5 domain-containing protein n=1 Tax=Fonsecaea erecta TaxID=1367422 RepID=A0A178ZWZ2_9EURO|nr:hypothetical protein AYL99_03153 [Fonsecaea erecta]OAP63926.1 hypothetical protein AYL99_03153 [Fonsecaea erecta]